MPPRLTEIYPRWSEIMGGATLAARACSLSSSRSRPTNAPGTSDECEEGGGWRAILSADEMATAAQEGAETEGVGVAVGWVGWRLPGTTTSPKPNTEKG